MESKQASVRLAGQSGFTLVELMVAMLLGLILSAGVINIYLESKKNYANEDEAARMQENGRYALNVLKRELTLAGFLGGVVGVDENAPDAEAVSGDCDGGGSNWVLDMKDTPPIEMIDDFSGSLDTLSGINLSCLTAGDIQTGTDIVAIKRTAGDYTLKNGTYNSGISAADDKQWYLRIDDGAESAKTSWVYLGTGEDIPPADATADSEINYWEYYTKIFYIREYSDAGDGVPTLCVERLANSSMSSECLVEGIEDMQIEYGIDDSANEDGTPDQFKAAPTSAEVSYAVAARIYLLVRSVNAIPNYTNSKTYTLGTKNVAAKNDGFPRRVFTTTVQLRNRILPKG